MTRRSAAGRRARIAAAATIAAILVIAGLVIRLEPGGPAPADAVVVVDGISYAQEDLEAFLGDTSIFRSIPATTDAIETFALHVLLRREAARRGLAWHSDGEMLDALIKELDTFVPVSEAEVAAFYQTNLKRFVSPRSVQFSYVRVPRRGEAETERDAIRSIAIRAQMSRRPQALASLAEGTGSPASAGQSGVVACAAPEPGAIPDTVVEKACAMAPGSISNPIETSDSYWVVYKRSDHPARHLMLSQVRFDIQEELTSAAHRDAKERAIQWLLRSGRVEIRPDAVARLTARAPPKDSTPTRRPPGAPGMGTG